MKERDYTLDLIKLIAIILVICYHSFYLERNNIYYIPLYTLCSMGVPMFFFVNGALILNKKFILKNHCKKICKLIVLTLIWSILILTIIQVAGFIHNMSLIEYIKTIIYLKTGYVINQYWFLLALVMIYVIFPLIKRTFDCDKYSIYFFLAIVFILTFGNKTLYIAHQIINLSLGNEVSSEVKNYIPWYNIFYNMFNSYAFVYFIIGGISKSNLYTSYNNYPNKRNKQYNIFTNKKLLSIIFSFGFITSIILSFILIKYIKWDPCFDGYDTPFTFLMTISFCLIIIQLNIYHIPTILEIISKNTFGIYLIHGILIYLTKPYILQTSLLTNTIGYIGYVSCILFVSLAIVLIIKRIPYLGFIIKL